MNLLHVLERSFKDSFELLFYQQSEMVCKRLALLSPLQLLITVFTQTQFNVSELQARNHLGSFSVHYFITMAISLGIRENPL